MLSKVNRLARRSDLLVALRRGQLSRAGLLSVRVVRTGRPVSRFAFVVSNKVSKRATVRNRLRRQLREITRSWLPQIHRGYDVVVTVHPGRAVLATAELAETLRWCLSRSQLLLP